MAIIQRVVLVNPIRVVLIIHNPEQILNSISFLNNLICNRQFLKCMLNQPSFTVRSLVANLINGDKWLIDNLLLLISDSIQFHNGGSSTFRIVVPSIHH